MNWLVSAFGVLILAIGLLGLVDPQRVVGRIRALEPRAQLGLAVGVRAVMGVILILAAPECRHPTAVMVLGAIALVAAVALPFLGAERLRALVVWWSERPPSLQRVSFSLTGIFGVFLVVTGLP